MNIEAVKDLNNSELLNLYKLVVEYDHYDPLVTPETVDAVRKAGVTTEMIADIILKRMDS